MTILKEIATTINEEANKQLTMLDDLENQVDSVADHLGNVNKNMKTTLEKVGRRGDKFCVDIICLVILLGLGAVIYNLAK